MDNIVDLTIENFQQVLLEQSQSKLVIVDFWADWCEACKTLMPVMEKLATEYGDKVILAKVNADEQQQIAMQFGVRSLPTVILVKDGQPIDGFAGAQSEGEIRAVLDKHLPKAEEEKLEQARAALAEKDNETAFKLAKEAHDLAPERADIKLVLIEAYINLGHIPQAKQLLETIKLADQDAAYHSLKGRIELAEQASETPEIKALQEKLQQNPDDLEVKVQLAVQLQQANRAEEALEFLLQVLQKDMNFGEARKLMMDTINALPDGDPLASQYRRKMYSLMY
ncbi:Protein disulfide-isomerase A3 [Saliniradius amylolyticus]|uniref:Thioredoxin n=1 Tax=Saliniradius amylolyticus TaxID=2183582 RepID=A0A2S2E0S2_9ALTE|nr:thioredoxin [Saliniradius amylolyticus]AWL10880.1 Protein disulfide-isomerase A3 [Saliniradius amylolyticus]